MERLLKNMSIKILDKFEKEQTTMSGTYCNTMIELAKADDRVFALDADLIGSSGMRPFANEFPDRMIDCGIQEADMIGIAAGLSATGKIPFAHSFGVFATRRAFDQVFVSAAYARLNVKIIGSDPGVTAAYNGGTHMPFEDAGIMRSIPTMTVIEPTDSVMLKDIITQIKDLYGVYYIRLNRKNAVGIYEEGSTFDINKGVILKDGKDVTIIASGIMVSESLAAAKILESQGIFARVVNIFTWKPIDKDLIEKCSVETGAIVTAENHNVVNGLSSAVSDVIVSKTLVPLENVGIMDQFGEVGTEDYLIKRFNLLPENIVEAAKRAIARKLK